MISIVNATNRLVDATFKFLRGYPSPVNIMAEMKKVY